MPKRIFASASALTLAFFMAPAMAEDFVQFQSPTGNIHCYIWAGDPAEARCDIIDFRPSFTTAPNGCDLDWGNAFIVEESGSGLLACIGDTAIDRSAQVLHYGETMSVDGLTCTSETTGMTCENEEGGGFHLARAAQTIY